MAEGGDSLDIGRKSGGTWRDKIPDISSLYLGSEDVEPVLCREHGQEFDHFCKSHMTELCNTCRRKSHRNCKTVIDIKEAANDLYRDSHGDKTIQSVKDLIERFQDFKVAAKNLQSLFPSKRQHAVDKVKQARKDLDNYLNELENEAVAEIDCNINGKMQPLEEQIHVCEASLSSLSTHKSDIVRTMSVGGKEEKFIAVNRATKQTKLYCDMLMEMYSKMFINVDFEPNVTLPDIFQSLGTVSVETSRVSDVFTDTTPIYTGEMKPKKHVSDEPPIVVSFDVLQDGRKLVLDYLHNNIQLYDKNNTFLTETALPVPELDEACLSVVLNSSNEALVSTDEGSLFKVMIGDVLTVREVKTNHRIYSMTKYGEDVVCMVICLDQLQFQLCVIDKDMGKIIKTILKDDSEMFLTPAFLGVSADKNTIYVVDRNEGCYGITLDGQIVFHYKNPGDRGYYGLVVDSDGLFVRSDGQVEKLNFNGEREEVFPIFGDSAPLTLMENELVVVQWNDRIIRFYCLLKK